MKKVFLSFALIYFMSSGLVMAQKNIVSVEPVRVWNGLRLKYERVFGEKFTSGSQATLYYGKFPGYQIAPFAKYYFKAKAPEGFYAQAKLPLGVFKVKDEDGHIQPESTFNAGLGVGCGWQMLWGKHDKWSLDFSMGLKFVGPPSKDPGGDLGEALSTAGWYLTGPGSIIDCLLTIGYRL